MDNYSEFKTLLYRHIQPNISNDVHLQEINIINTKNEEDKIVLISVDASNDVCSTISGDTYIRKGNSNRKIGNQEIIRLKYEK
jgi:predicted HTH transcriptional regulator